MPRQHTYAVSVTWIGNRGTGTSGYRDYGRDHEVTAEDPGRAGSAKAAEAPGGGAGTTDAADSARAAGTTHGGAGAADDASPARAAGTTHGGAGTTDAASPARAAGALPPPIAGSSDRAFRGDPGRWNPEQLLTAALSQCHMLAYLHLCATAGVVVTGYRDHAVAVMAEDGDGGGRFVEAVLHPHVTVGAAADIEKARALHHDAHEKCFIASSVNFAVRHEPVVTAGS